MVENEVNQVNAGVEWKRWPLAEEGSSGWAKAALVLLLLIAIWLLLAFSLPLLVAGALEITLVAALLPFFAPARYRVDAEGIAIRRGLNLVSNHKPWRNFMGCKEEGNGFWLLPAENNRASFVPVRPLFLPEPLHSESKSILRRLIETHFPVL